MTAIRSVYWALVLSCSFKATIVTANPALPEYPPQKISIEELEKGLVGVLVKGLEGAQRNKANDKLDLKSCYDSGHANGSLFYATQVPGFDWRELENKVNKKLNEKKLKAYRNYGEMITELVSDWQRCTK
jgi:hypothetical protein